MAVDVGERAYVAAVVERELLWAKGPTDPEHGEQMANSVATPHVGTDLAQTHVFWRVALPDLGTATSVPDYSVVCDIEEFDGPLLSEITIDGRPWLMKWASCFETTHRWILSPSSRETIDAYVAGSISMRDALMQGRPWLLLDLVGGEAVRCAEVESSDVPEAYLPQPGAMFDECLAPLDSRLVTRLRAEVAHDPEATRRVDAAIDVCGNHLSARDACIIMAALGWTEIGNAWGRVMGLEAEVEDDPFDNYPPLTSASKLDVLPGVERAVLFADAGAAQTITSPPHVMLSPDQLG